MDQIAFGVGQDMPIAALLRVRIIAARTAAVGGLTLWLSMTPALGEASRP